MQQKQSSGSAIIESIDRNKVLEDLQARAADIGKARSDVLVCILYGSMLKGHYTPASDIDILIIVRAATEPFLQRADAFRDFFLQLPMDVDLKVYTRQEVQSMLEEGNAYLEEALQEGKVLWKGSDVERRP
jgi:predicted nucleotidyltransferase